GDDEDVAAGEFLKAGLAGRSPRTAAAAFAAGVSAARAAGQEVCRRGQHKEGTCSHGLLRLVKSRRCILGEKIGPTARLCAVLAGRATTSATLPAEERGQVGRGPGGGEKGRGGFDEAEGGDQAAHVGWKRGC